MIHRIYISMHRKFARSSEETSISSKRIFYWRIANNKQDMSEQPHCTDCFFSVISFNWFRIQFFLWLNETTSCAIGFNSRNKSLLFNENVILQLLKLISMKIDVDKVFLWFLFYFKSNLVYPHVSYTVKNFVLNLTHFTSYPIYPL